VKERVRDKWVKERIQAPLILACELTLTLSIEAFVYLTKPSAKVSRKKKKPSAKASPN
jgi:hypothetical protein